MLRDPGAKPSVSYGFRWQNDDASDSIYVMADSTNDGTWGYNNLQWYGITFYHKINNQWHFSWENYTLSQHNVLNVTDPGGIIFNGGFPFTPANGINFNAPNFAACPDPAMLACTARVFTSLIYINYQATPLDNIGFRSEFYHDMEGQRTASTAGTRFMEWTLAWQHWWSPQVEFRPEVAFYHSFDAAAFNANPYRLIPPNKKDAWISSADIIWHF
jgi:hypothetical protein